MGNARYVKIGGGHLLALCCHDARIIMVTISDVID
jgi:hypothetical protein